MFGMRGQIVRDVQSEAAQLGAPIDTSSEATVSRRSCRSRIPSSIKSLAGNDIIDCTV